MLISSRLPVDDMTIIAECKLYTFVLQKDDSSQVGVGMCKTVYCMHCHLHQSLFCHFTETKHQHDDDDDDSDMGPSIFTDTKSTIFSEVTVVTVINWDRN